MVRYRLHGEIQYGKFREALEIWKQIAALSVKRGWPKPTMWSPVVGQGNMMIVEIDYPDLATFDRVFQEFQTGFRRTETFGIACVSSEKRLNADRSSSSRK